VAKRRIDSTAKVSEGTNRNMPVQAVLGTCWYNF